MIYPLELFRKSLRYSLVKIKIVEVRFIEVKPLSFSEIKFSNILDEMKVELDQFFVDYPEDGAYFYRVTSRRIAGDNPNFINFEVYSDSVLVGFYIFTIRNGIIFLRWVYFISDIDKATICSESLKTILKLLREGRGKLGFENTIFTFPTEYLSEVFDRLEIEYLSRSNMVLDIDQLNGNQESSYLVEPISESDFETLSMIGVDVYRGTDDLKFSEDKTTPKLYMEYLIDDFMKYALLDLSLKIVDCSGKILGFTLVEDGDKGEVYLQEVVVDPKYQGKGIGKVLIEKTIEGVNKSGRNRVILTVTDSNLGAKKLYQSLGFKLFSREMRVV